MRSKKIVVTNDFYLDFDLFIGVVSSNLIDVPNWSKAMHKTPHLLAPLLIETPDGKAGFFNYYLPSHPSAIAKLSQFDVIEFGRKYRVAETLKPKPNRGIIMIPKGTTPEQLAEMRNAEKKNRQKQIALNPLHDPRVIEAIYQTMKVAFQKYLPRS